MSTILIARVREMAGEPVVGAGGVHVAEVIERLEREGDPAALCEALKIDAADLLAALAFEALGSIESVGPALVQTPPRRPKFLGALSEPSLARLFPGTARPGRLSLSAGLLQMHGFWDASHEAAQEADDLGEKAVASYWHGIAHRREPDAGNASYWFRNVGRHRVFEPLAKLAQPLVAEHASDAMIAKVCNRQGGWDPFAMIELCTRARPGSAQAEVAQKLQRLEMSLLLDFTAAAAGVTILN